MNRWLISILLVLIGGTLRAQGISFPPIYSDTVQIAAQPLINGSGEDVEICDIDNDGDMDVFVSTSSGGSLFINDGLGNFTETPTPGLTHMSQWGAIRWGQMTLFDYDNDGDLDMHQHKSGVYDFIFENNAGTYSEDYSVDVAAHRETPLTPFDKDGDGDQDFVLLRFLHPSSYFFELHENNGSGGFSMDSSFSIPSYYIGEYQDVQAGDYDSDGDIDLLIGNQDSIALFSNDSAGHFTRTFSFALPPMSGSNRRIFSNSGDYNQDGAIDLAFKLFGVSGVFLYLNNGNGQFTLDTVNVINAFSSAAPHFVDLNNDSYPDLLVARGSGSVDVYSNDSTGVFVQLQNEIIRPTSKFITADLNGDSLVDILTSGSNADGSRLMYYENLGGFQFRQVNELPWIANTAITDIQSGDVDGDGDVDFVVLDKSNGSGVRDRAIYLNDGSTFNRSFFPMDYLSSGAIAIGNIDSDVDEEIYTMGINSSGMWNVSIYDHRELGQYYVKKGSSGTTPFSNGKVILKDLNNDGHADIISTGAQQFNVSTMALLNDGTGQFLPQPSSLSMTGVTSGTLLVEDFTGDTVPDIFVSGSGTSALYVNNGYPSFTSRSTSNITNINFTSGAAGDVDNDGDMDIILSGEVTSGSYLTQLYLNDGNGNFTADTNQFEDVRYGKMILEDIDGDTDLDLLYTGSKQNLNSSIFRIYINTDNGNFIEYSQSDIRPLGDMVFDILDIDNDGTFEVLTQGKDFSNNNKYTLQLYDILNSCAAPDLTVDTITSCSNYTWINGQRYTTSRSDVELQYVNSFGCDSIHRLELTIIPDTVHITDSIQACGKYTWINGVTYTSSQSGIQQYYERLNNCDSIVTLYLDIYREDSTIQYIDTCASSFYWAANNQNYSQSGHYMTTIQSGHGCDSVVELFLNIAKPYLDTVHIADCKPIAWINGQTYSQSTDSAIFRGQTHAGCDSVIILSFERTRLDTTLQYANGTLQSNAQNVLFQWYDCTNDSIIPGALYSTFEPEYNSTYAVILNNLECIDTSTCITIQDVSIEEDGKSDLLVYPNPSDGVYSIESDRPIKSITVIGTDGRQVYIIEDIHDEIFQLNLTEIANGTYILQTTFMDGSSVQTLISKR